MPRKILFALTEEEYRDLLLKTEPAESLAYWFAAVVSECMEHGMVDDEESTMLCQVLRFIGEKCTPKAKELVPTPNTGSPKLPEWVESQNKSTNTQSMPCCERCGQNETVEVTYWCPDCDYHW